MLTKREIAEAEDISPAYVQQLLMRLGTTGFVHSHRGKAGGFTLARAPEMITVLDVLKACEGEIVLSPCVNTVTCKRGPGCHTRLLWVRAAELLDNFFGGVTIAELAGPDARGWFLDT